MNGDNCEHGQIGFGGRAYITDALSATPLTWDEILNVIDVTEPDQSWNTTEQPLLNQQDGGTHTAPTTLQFGQFQATIQHTGSDENNDGLVTARDAWDNKRCVAVRYWSTGDATLSMVMMAGFVVGIVPGTNTVDGNRTSVLTVQCNAKYVADPNAGEEPEEEEEEQQG